MCFDLGNECIREKIRNVVQETFLIKNTKGIYF